MSLGFSTECRRKKRELINVPRHFHLKLMIFTYVTASPTTFTFLIILYARDLSELDAFQWGTLSADVLMLTQLSLVTDVDQNSAFGAVIHRGFESVGTE